MLILYATNFLICELFSVCMGAGARIFRVRVHVVGVVGVCGWSLRVCDRQTDRQIDRDRQTETEDRDRDRERDKETQFVQRPRSGEQGTLLHVYCRSRVRLLESVKHGLYSLSGKTSFCQISWSQQAPSLGVKNDCIALKLRNIAAIEVNFQSD